MDVNEGEALDGVTDLVLNSYDMSVDIELADAIQRLRFEHPEVNALIVTSAKDRVFCAGANIRMLAASEHAFKVNFCKFTNETRLYIEDASEHSGLNSLAACNGTASGGGYELALACDRILLVDDRNSAVSFPETPLLAVLPGTGGLTRVVDKRLVRPDLADVFSTTAEGIRGKRAVKWNLVDRVAPLSRFNDAVAEEARALADAVTLDKPKVGVTLHPLEATFGEERWDYKHVSVLFDADDRTATITLRPRKKAAQVIRTRSAMQESLGGPWRSSANSTMPSYAFASTRWRAVHGSSVQKVASSMSSPLMRSLRISRTTGLSPKYGTT